MALSLNLMTLSSFGPKTNAESRKKYDIVCDKVLEELSVKRLGVQMAACTDVCRSLRVKVY